MSKSRPQQALAVVAAMLLVATAVGGAAGVSPVGTASAQAADTEECSTWDAIIYDFANVGNFNLFGGEKESNPCSAQYVKQEISDEWNATDAAETKAEIHARASQLSTSNEQYLTSVDNGLTNSETIAFSRAEAAAVETLSNGGTIAEAKQAANESIEQFYTTKQLNLIDSWEVSISTIESLKTRSVNTTGISSDFVTVGEPGDLGDNQDVGSRDEPGENYLKYNKSVSRQVTVLNGTIVQYQSAEVVEVSESTQVNGEYFNNSFEVGIDQTWVENDALLNGSFGFGGDNNRIRGTQVKARPTDNLTSTVALNFKEFRETFNDIENKSVKTEQEAAVYINQSLAPAAEDGDISDHISASTLVQEYAQNINGSDGYVRALAVAASSGMSTPDLEGTASMTVTHNGTTYQGMLLSQNAPDGGTWQAGETYDATLIGGKQFFAVADSESGEVIELDGPFTVDSIEDMSGNSVDTAQTQEYSYTVTNQSANYSELQQQITSLQESLELQKERATAPEPGAGGGGGDGGWGLPSISDLLPSTGVLAGLAAGGGVLALVGLVVAAILIGIIIRVVL